MDSSKKKKARLCSSLRRKRELFSCMYYSALFLRLDTCVLWIGDNGDGDDDDGGGGATPLFTCLLVCPFRYAAWSTTDLFALS